MLNDMSYPEKYTELAITFLLKLFLRSARIMAFVSTAPGASSASKSPRNCS